MLPFKLSSCLHVILVCKHCKCVCKPLDSLVSDLLFVVAACIAVVDGDGVRHALKLLEVQEIPCLWVMPPRPKAPF